MDINVDVAMKIWNDFFDGKEWAQDCYGTWMNRSAYSNEEVVLKIPGYLGMYDCSWNIDHIRPKSSFKNENDADFLNNFEPIHRQNNLTKGDKTAFYIENNRYWVVKDKNGYNYGIKNIFNVRVDGKAKGNFHY